MTGHKPPKGSGPVNHNAGTALNIPGPPAQEHDEKDMTGMGCSTSSLDEPLQGLVGEAVLRGTKGQDLRVEQRPALDGFLAGVEARAFRMARIATRHDEDALDIVQDAMAGLATKYAHRPEQEWAPLFHRILQSRIRDWYRRAKVRRRLQAWLGVDGEEEGEDPLLQIPERESAGPEGQLREARRLRLLDDALRALPLRQQQAFLLRTWEGLDVKETALAMGCGEGSVKTHYSRAVHTLRARLAGERDD